MSEQRGGEILGGWDDCSQLVHALEAPCLQRRLSCSLEQSSEDAAIVMRRLP